MSIVGKLHYLAIIMVLTLFAVPAMADTPPKQNRMFYANYALTLSADGTIEKLEPLGKAHNPLIADFLEKSVRSWKFTPGSIGGVPQRTESALWLNVEAVPREDGKFDIVIVDAHTGPFGTDGALTPPSYPTTALQYGHEAVLRLKVTYDSEGNVTKVERAGKLIARQERYLKPFEIVSFQAVRKWHFKPEKVGGIGVSATVIVPIQFCMQETECRSLLRGTEEKEKLARQLISRVYLGSSQVSIQRTDQLN